MTSPALCLGATNPDLANLSTVGYLRILPQQHREEHAALCVPSHSLSKWPPSERGNFCGKINESRRKSTKREEFGAGEEVLECWDSGLEIKSELLPGVLEMLMDCVNSTINPPIVWPVPRFLTLHT